MKFILMNLCTLVLLTGCIQYTGIHSHSTSYNPASLAIHHDYSLSATKKTSTASQYNWWDRFQDTQLNQFITIALADSPTMKIAENRLERAQHLSEGAGAALWPTLNFDANVSRQRYSATGNIVPPYNGETVSQGNVFLNFQYDFDFWGKNRENVAAMVSRAKASQADLAEAALVISTSVASTYFQLQGSLVQLAIAEETEQQMQAMLNITQLLTQHDIKSALPLNVAIANLQTAVMTVAQAKQAVLLTRHQLAVLLGKNPFTTDISVSPFVFNKQSVFLPSNLPANLIAQRPDIIASKWWVEAAAHRVNVSKARFFPDINILAFYSYQSIGLNRLFQAESRDYAVQPAIDLPIFDAGLRRANLKTQYAKYDMAVNQYNQTILIALRQVADQLSILESVKSQLASKNKAVLASQHNFSLRKLRYQKGIDAYMSVLNSKVVLLDQEHAQVDLEVQSILAMIGIIKALGGSNIPAQGQKQ